MAEGGSTCVFEKDISYGMKKEKKKNQESKYFVSLFDLYTLHRKVANCIYSSNIKKVLKSYVTDMLISMTQSDHKSIKLIYSHIWMIKEEMFVFKCNL